MLALGIATARVMGWDLRAWWLASVALVAVALITRLVPAAERDDVNLVVRVWPGLEPAFPGHASFLAFLAIVLLFSLGLIAYRADRLKGHGELDSIVSRESAFLLNNVVLIGICFTVFLGTIFPLLAEALQRTKISVGTPYFNRVSVPLGMALLLLMGIGPL